MTKFDTIFSSDDMKVIIIESDGKNSCLQAKDYNPLPSISLPLSSHFNYITYKRNHQLHAGTTLFERGQIDYKVSKTRNSKDKTLSFLIDDENLILPIAENEVTRVVGRTVPINFLINKVLQSTSKLSTETLCLEIIEMALNINPMSPALVNTVNISQIDDSRHFIVNNFARDITIGDIARAACLSTFHFIRVFKKMLGYSPYQYLMAYRLERAKSLLKNDASVSDVAFDVGFNSLENFSYSFRKCTGLSPSEFKKWNQNRQKF